MLHTIRNDPFRLPDRSGQVKGKWAQLAERKERLVVALLIYSGNLSIYCALLSKDANTPVWNSEFLTDTGQWVIQTMKNAYDFYKRLYSHTRK